MASSSGEVGKQEKRQIASQQQVLKARRREATSNFNKLKRQGKLGSV